MTPRTPRRRVTRSGRRVLAGTVALALSAAAAACSGSSLDDNAAAGGGDGITIGLIWPKTEPYKSLGDDMAEGWELYLAAHGGKLGGHTITTVTADEGTDEATARTSARKLLDADHATVLVGTASAVPSVAIAPEVTKRKVPFIGTGGRPSTLKDISYVWHTSWLSRETGAAIAPYLAKNAGGSVYAIGPDYQGGYDQMGGFTDAFVRAGGKLANPDGKTAWTPFPGTKDYKPFLNKIRATGAKAVYCFYAGNDAVQFVKDYRDAGLGDIPLYGAGFLTEGDALSSQGATADGVYTVLNYAPTVPGSANAAFVQDFQAKYQRAPTLYNVTAWDAAMLLDQAIAAAGPDPTGEAINTAISRIGQLNSPRGPWRFDTAQHIPLQAFYLRRVQNDGRARGNVVIDTLVTSMPGGTPATSAGPAKSGTAK